ncbi:hypothetical protein [Paenibacillus sp. GXUN7292]|uniref:hypothetical protein n=1 Tax=Paenibacillus sp. GXUN7292 TaxID=3422499 RepID=UPI003D7E21E6
MDKRSFLLGLGIGIIVGALLLQLISLGNDSKEKLNEKSQEINGNSQLLGDGQADGGTVGMAGPQAQADTDNGTAEPSKEVENNTENVENNAETAEIDTEQDAQGQPSVTAAPAVSREQLILRIEPGFTLSAAAKLLHEQKVLEDTESFVATMKKKVNGSIKKVRAGCFLFEEQMSPDEVARIVTSQPLSKEQAREYAAENNGMNVPEICL